MHDREREVVMSSLKDALNVDHAFLTELKLLSHLINLLIISLNDDLGQGAIICNYHLNLNLLLSRRSVPVVCSPAINGITSANHFSKS